MAIIKCPECGHQISDQAKTCPSCGIEIEGKIMKCPDCGEIVFKDQEVCPNCHCPLHVGVVPVRNLAGITPVRETPTAAEAEIGTPDAVAGGNDTPIKAKTTEKKSYKSLIVTSFIIALVVVFGAVYFYTHTNQQNEMDAYENAMESDEPAVLQNYLDMYADAPEEHRDSIFAHLEQLKNIDAEWTDAVVSGSKTALEKYIQLHPSSVHVNEAKIKIDSLDWMSATTDNTPEAYQAYMDEHQDGAYIDEAKSKFDKLNAQTVSPADKQTISQLFSGYFSALSSRDEDGLTSNIDNIMNSFLHKANATKVDVISYMNKLYEDADIKKMNFRLNNDWKINKKEVSDGEYEYTVSFSVDQKIERSDPEKGNFNTYKVDAKISPDNKITDLNMKKIVQ